MKYLFLFAAVFSTAYATDYSPWFTPPFEFQGRLRSFYVDQHRIQTPKGSFNDPSNNIFLQGSLAVTPWPNWNIETELFLSQTSDITFTYEAAFLTIRYAWLDDICDDPVSLITGITLSFPGNHFLREFYYTYHGNVNGELHATLGKEWACGCQWVTRIWGLGGIGIANEGSAWLHALGVWEFNFGSFQPGIFSEAIYGLGDQDIIPNVPFQGYANINHQSIILGGCLNYNIAYFGTLTILGWYNVHARNYVENYWGAGASLLIPFSIL